MTSNVIDRVKDDFKISPTNFQLWRENKMAWWAKYAVKNLDREPQTLPMSLGSAFDSMVKGELYEILLGQKGMFEQLFEASVEKHNRDQILPTAKLVYEEYKRLGGVANIAADLRNATEIHMEVSVKGMSNIGVQLNGKPDLWYIGRDGKTIVIHDWKVNGYFSASGTSPKPGYTRTYGGSGRINNAISQSHPALTRAVSTEYFETVGQDWAVQECMYSWMLGCEDINNVICSIDQLTFRNGTQRVTSYAGLLGQKFVDDLKDEVIQMDQDIRDGHPFKDKSLEDCKAVLAQFSDPDFAALMANVGNKKW